jgi:predicted ribosome quality control (RQC) complex YloA/Tae2 family protein
VSEWAAKVIRIDQPELGLLSLSFRAEGRNGTLIIAALPGTFDLGIVEHRPRGTNATPSTTQLRRHLEGSTIVGVQRSNRAARISLMRGNTRRALIASPIKPYGGWWLCEEDGSIVVRSPGATRDVPLEAEHLRACEPDALRKRGEAVLIAHEEGRRRQLARRIERRIKRLTRTREAILGDLERARQAEGLSEKAGLLLAHAAEIPSDASYFEAAAWDDPARSIRIDLDPRKSPAELAQDLFAKAKRLKRGLNVAPARLASIEQELASLARLRDEAGEHPIAALTTKLAELGVAPTEPAERERKRRRAGGRLPYREFQSGEGLSVLVGRGAADNDRLTLRVARPHDLWLHARGVTGAHVVVPLAKGKSCPPETLVDAAMLAAHFSDLRGEPIVDVIYTARRFVRKRKGSAIGSVTLEREKVIAVRVEPKRLERLLGNEKKSS